MKSRKKEEVRTKREGEVVGWLVRMRWRRRR